MNSTSKIEKEEDQNNIDNPDHQADVDSSMLENSHMAGTLKTREERIYNKSRSIEREGTMGSLKSSEHKHT